MQNRKLAWLVLALSMSLTHCAQPESGDESSEPPTHAASAPGAAAPGPAPAASAAPAPVASSSPPRPAAPAVPPVAPPPPAPPQPSDPSNPALPSDEWPELPGSDFPGSDDEYVPPQAPPQSGDSSWSSGWSSGWSSHWEWGWETLQDVRGPETLTVRPDGIVTVQRGGDVRSRTLPRSEILKLNLVLKLVLAQDLEQRQSCARNPDSTPSRVEVHSRQPKVFRIYEGDPSSNQACVLGQPRLARLLKSRLDRLWSRYGATTGD